MSSVGEPKPESTEVFNFSGVQITTSSILSFDIAQQIVISPLPKSLHKLRKAISPLIDLSTAPSLGLEGIENIAPYFLVRIPECRVGLV